MKNTRGLLKNFFGIIFILSIVFIALPMHASRQATQGAYQSPNYDDVQAQQEGQQAYSGSTPSPTNWIKATSDNLNYNGATSIQWGSFYTNPTDCIVSGPNVYVNSNSGTASTGHLISDSTYTILCETATGAANDSVTIHVANPLPPTVDIYQSNYSGSRIALENSIITYNHSTYIHWISSGASACTTSGPGITTSFASSGTSSTGSLTGDATYTITCSNSGGSKTKSVKVTVIPAITNNNFWAGKSGGSDINSQIKSISFGKSFSLNWNVRGTGATSCKIKNSTMNSLIYTLDSNDLSNTQGYKYIVSISTPTNYSLTCSTTPMNTCTDCSPASTGYCQGTVVGTKYQYEGQSCSQFKTRTTCVQGWLTHGCHWVSS